MVSDCMIEEPKYVHNVSIAHDDEQLEAHKMWLRISQFLIYSMMLLLIWAGQVETIGLQHLGWPCRDYLGAAEEKSQDKEAG